MALQRETMIRTALALLDEVGLEGLTVRRLAERLGVQNPALYWHFKNKQDLLDGMATTMLADAFADIAPPTSEVPWTAWLTDAARAFRRALLSHRDGPQVLAGANLGHSPLLVGVEQALQMLRAAGFNQQDALVGTLAIFDYTLGATFEQQADPTHSRITADAGRDTAHGLREARMPTLAAALEAIARDGNSDISQATFEGGLGLLLAGMQASLQKPPE